LPQNAGLPSWSWSHRDGIRAPRPTDCPRISRAARKAKQQLADSMFGGAEASGDDILEV
jgi:hypothetical protein